MKLLIDRLTEVISKEALSSSDAQKQEEFYKLLSDLRKAGVIKKPVYDLPQVDTIGKAYYPFLNKRK